MKDLFRKLKASCTDLNLALVCKEMTEIVTMPEQQLMDEKDRRIAELEEELRRLKLSHSQPESKAVFLPKRKAAEDLVTIDQETLNRHLNIQRK